MKRFIRELRPLTIALFVLNAGLLALVLWRASVGTQTKSLLATPAETLAAPKARLSAAIEPPSFALIQDQPLFHESRRFFVPPDPAAAPLTPPVPDCRLAGTFIIPHKPSVALLTYVSTGVSRKVRAEDDLDGWKVKAVERSRVVLEFGDHSIEIVGNSQTPTAGLQVIRSSLQAALPREPNGIRVLGSGGEAPSSAGSMPASSQARLYRPPSP